MQPGRRAEEPVSCKQKERAEAISPKKVKLRGRAKPTPPFQNRRRFSWASPKKERQRRAQRHSTANKRQSEGQREKRGKKRKKPATRQRPRAYVKHSSTNKRDKKRTASVQPPTSTAGERRTPTEEKEKRVSTTRNTKVIKEYIQAPTNVVREGQPERGRRRGGGKEQTKATSYDITTQRTLSTARETWFRVKLSWRSPPSL